MIIRRIMSDNGQSPAILQYKTSIIDSCKFVTEYNLPSNECVDLAGHYTEPVIIQKIKEQTNKIYCQHVRSVHTSESKPPSQLLSNDKNRSIRIDQLFSPDCDGNTQKTVILSGDSGRGKSFTLQKIMLDWASGELYSEKFDVVFLLKSEELKCISEEMSLFELLSWSCSLTLDQISQILDLTPEKVLILIDETDELTVDYLYNVGDLIQILGESKILRKLKVQEDEYSAESLIWSLDLSVTHEDVLLSLSSSEKNPSFPAVLNITLTCPQSEISSTDWTLFLQRLSKTAKVAKVSSAQLDEHVSLLLSSFYSVGLKTLDLKLVVLNESWASGIISLVQTCTSLQQLRLDVRHRQMFESLSHISLTCPRSALSNSDWKIFFQTFHKQTKYKPDSPDCNEQADALFSFLHSVCDLKSVELIVFKLNQSWALRILALIQACSSLQEIRRKCSKLTDQCKEQDWSHSCNEKVEIHFKPNILRGLEELNISELSGLNLQPLPVCQSCVHIGDSDQWVQVEPSVCTDEGGSEFRIILGGSIRVQQDPEMADGSVQLVPSLPVPWAVDGCFLREELEEASCERIGPVI
ncbi:hypothetical protein cypCar_00039788 [Cyprinus carpio]|nr:hypothetical protein cypCar_00039788 [Cyprinus carpio]